jgi:hypothetical protein
MCGFRRSNGSAAPCLPKRCWLSSRYWTASDAGDSRSLKKFLVRIRQKLVKSRERRKRPMGAHHRIHLLADALLRHGTLSGDEIFELAA